MAGHRRTRKPGTSTARKRHHANARALLLERFENSPDAAGRLAAAVDYVRGAHARATRRGNTNADAALERAIRALVSAGDRLIQ